ncbi:nuclear transport factor 2 family protein [Microbulbifer sp. OS29]|uniref:Nuclear transport factor 2 family protein n=1 Tax=Microbulbifer okhotskensis TaxID=2926617 RepID=A0A9X2ELA2_9GAMM|nr:nuclear transport factor 2 family protein [Microbulbifer okhotskensis]MCO1333714.1 nuclear transport factor 2 family protein [Microbulbifer okhotskensis]
MRSLVLALPLTVTAIPAAAGDREDLHQLVTDFISKAASDSQAHQRFWAEELIYTNSSGKRFGKSEIMQGMQSPSEEPITVKYSAEDIDIRLLGDTAIVAFKLIAHDSNKTEENHYFNTGTFIKHRGEWRALAWQATNIPIEN